MSLGHSGSRGLAGITVLCDQPALFARLRHQGAEVIPHARQAPWQDGQARWQNVQDVNADSSVAIPLLAGISDTEAQVQQLLQGLNQRSSHNLHGQQEAWNTVTPLFFNQLDQWLKRFEHHPEQIARGLELLQLRLPTWRATGKWHALSAHAA